MQNDHIVIRNKLPKIAGYKAIIKQIPSANTLSQLFMVKFIAAPSKKLDADNEKQQEPNMEKNTTSFSDNKAKTDNETPSQIIDMPKARSTETNNDKENKNPKAKSASNAIMMNAKTGKANTIQPRTITYQIITKKANANIMPKPKIALSNKELAVNKIQPHTQSIAKTKLHKTAALLPQTGENKNTTIGLIGALAILLALLGLEKPKDKEKD